MDAQRQKSAVAWLSVISNTTLVAGKLIVGLAIGWVSVISEAIHSGVDLLAAVIALFAVKTSNKRADAEHPFGHGKVENLSGPVEALLRSSWQRAGSSTRPFSKLLAPEPLGAVGWAWPSCSCRLWSTSASRSCSSGSAGRDFIALQAYARHCAPTFTRPRA